MFPTLQIGPLSLQTPGLMLLLAVWLGLTLSERYAARHDVSPDTLYNLVFTALIAGVLGGRIVYAARFPSAFANSPLSLLSLNPGLFDVTGGLAAALLGAIIFGQRKELSLWPTLDALTPFFAVLVIGVGLSHLASGEAFGVETGLPWGIELWGARRHPTQIYEILAALLTLGLIWPKQADSQSPAGSRFLTFAALTAGARLFLEAFRGDSTLIFNGLRTAQLAAWVVLAAALWGLDRLGKPAKSQEQNSQ
ncbi:MAG: prolipoprotein diacylglyceryl transferase [Chloroflexi bacterium]|nr:prolipoprotein diacylglyceryl transferase [Chloroflexota bacterium]